MFEILIVSKKDDEYITKLAVEKFKDYAKKVKMRGIIGKINVDFIDNKTLKRYFLYVVQEIKFRKYLNKYAKSKFKPKKYKDIFDRMNGKFVCELCGKKINKSYIVKDLRVCEECKVML